MTGSSIKDLSRQTSEDKMYLLRLLSHQILGAKWMYYRKIKLGDEGFKPFKEKSLMEQMKATRAALRFTSKNTKKLYRQVFQDCIKDIRAYTGLKEGFPELPDLVEGQEVPSLTSEFDTIIISWTPVKFLLPAPTIRQKGTATQRHSEGLVAKLYFKIAAYYAAPENWDIAKLTLYLRKINKESSFQDVAAALEPLKTDLQRFSDGYEIFKFGKASLSKDVAQDIDAYDDAMSIESFDSQIRSLYWYDFIYRSLESFFFKYYLMLITSTSSRDAVRYLTTIFEPVFKKVIENKNIFLGSFETDRTKSQFRVPYQEYLKERSKEPLRKKIKTKEGMFESYCYNLQLIEKLGVSPDVESPPPEESEWRDFIEQHILAIGRPIIEMDTESEMEKGDFSYLMDDDLLDLSVRRQAFLMMLATLIKCSQFKRQAKYEVLERFKSKAKTDLELEKKRLEELKKSAGKKIFQMKKKLSKYQRMKQQETVDQIEKDIEKFQVTFEEKLKQIRLNSKEELIRQKKRLNTLFEEVSEDQIVDMGGPAKYILQLMKSIEPEDAFLNGISHHIADSIQNHYAKELEPLYANTFNVFNLSITEKIFLIQCLENSSAPDKVKLELDETDAEQFNRMVQEMKEEIMLKNPEVFENKVIFTKYTIPIGNLYKLNIDHNSFENLLSLKIASPKSSQYVTLKPDIIKTLVSLNKLINPLPKNDIHQEKMENDKNMEKRISANLLGTLLEQLN